MTNYAQLCLTKTMMGRQLEEANDEIELWQRKANQPNLWAWVLERQLQTCLDAGEALEQELEEVKTSQTALKNQLADLRSQYAAALQALVKLEEENKSLRNAALPLIQTNLLAETGNVEVEEGHASAPPSTMPKTAATSARTEATSPMVSQPVIVTSTAQEGITATKLAEHLGYRAASSVSRPANEMDEEDFAVWSARKDPRGKPWRYDKKSKTFFSY